MDYVQRTFGTRIVSRSNRVLMSFTSDSTHQLGGFDFILRAGFVMNNIELEDASTTFFWNL
jgi:hypothetical protein